MAIVKDMQDILNRYEEGFNAAWDEYKKANELYKQERMTGRMLDEKREKRNETLAQLTRAASDEITAAHKKYADTLPGRYEKNPDQLDTNALAMLTSAASGVIELTGTDLENLFNRFDGNLTMQAAISDFANKHETGARITFFSEKQRSEDAENYASACRRCLSTSPDNPNLPGTFAYYCEGTRAVPASLQGE